MKMGDFLAAPLGQPDYVIDQLVLRAAVSSMTGVPKVGKSTFIRRLLLAVARGEPVVGRMVHPVPCVYWALEDIPVELQREMQRIGFFDEAVYLRLRAASDPLSSIELLEQDILTARAGLAVVDPLVDILDVTDENAYVQNNRAMKRIVHIARSTACHIILVHHTNKSQYKGGRGILGSQAIRGATDANFFLSRTRNGPLRMSSEQRYGTPLDWTDIQWEPIEPTREQRVEHDLLMTLVDGMTKSAWCDSVRGASRETKFQVITNMVKRHIVNMTMDGDGTHHYYAKET
jgi:hypothetical protein